MSVGVKRTIGGTLGFAFAAMWMTVGAGSALACLAATGAGYGAVRLRESGALGSLVLAQAALRRDLRVRLAPAAGQVRKARQTAQPKAAAPRVARERTPQAAPRVMAVDPATYGW